MVKGRNFVPSTKNENHWFCARAWPSAVDKPELKTAPSLIPTGFQTKSSQMSRNEFPFSRHDNRNAFQGHGIYFGSGFGKRMLPEKRYQCSGTLLPLLATKTPNSCYTASYSHAPTTPGATHIEEHHRRYPHSHPVKSSKAKRPNTGRANLLTSLGNPYQTPLQVLAITQEPFLRASTWVYSYKPKDYNRFLEP